MTAFRLLLCGLCLFWGVRHARGTDSPWPRFRGPNGGGVSSSDRIPTVWTDNNRLWRADLPGQGHSSPVIWDEQLYVTCADDVTGNRSVCCLSLDQGKEVWSRSFPGATHATHVLNSRASSTPTVDDKHVYVAWGTPEQIKVVAMKHDGDVAWETDLGPYAAGHGFGQSLIVHQGRIVLPVEKGDGSFRVALRCDDGTIDWKVPCDSALHYATPCIRSTADGDELIFVNWEQGIVGVDPATEQTNWQADVFDKEHLEASISSPVLAGNLVIGVSGYLGHGYEAVAVDPDRRDDKIVWKLDRGAPLCTTPLVINGLVIFWADNGVVTCVDAATGEVQWRERVGGNFYSSPVAAGNAVYNISTDGEMIVLAAQRDFAELARNPLPEPSHATPAVVGDRMYVRTLTQLLCIGAAP